MKTRPFLVAALLGALTSCDDASGPAADVRIDVQAAGTVSDTIGAGAFELTVRATQGGRPLASEPIVFASAGAARVVLGQSPGNTEGAIETATDADGRARVFVRFADRAGAAIVRVTLPQRDVSADVGYTVLPGSAVGAAILPKDTALEVGTSFDLRAHAVDRAGNPTTGTAVVHSLTPAVATVTGSRTVRGVAVGRARIVARLGDVATDTALISVVPEHKLVAVAPAAAGGSDALLAFDLDGGARVILEILPTGAGAAAHPDWNPVTGRVAYELPHGSGRALHAVDFSAARGPVIDPATFASATWPQFSADGEWLFFAGRDAGGEPLRVWRAQHDGDIPIPVSEQTGADATAPSPAPDGARVAFTAADSIRVLDLGSGTSIAIAEGALPRWSPDGARIAFQDDGAIWLIRPDGAGRTRLTSEGSRWHAESLDWSPNSAWIVAHSFDDDMLHVIDVTSRLALPLPYARGWSQPAFAPPHIGP